MGAAPSQQWSGQAEPVLNVNTNCTCAYLFDDNVNVARNQLRNGFSFCCLD